MNKSKIVVQYHTLNSIVCRKQATAVHVYTAYINPIDISVRTALVENKMAQHIAKIDNVNLNFYIMEKFRP